MTTMHVVAATAHNRKTVRLDSRGDRRGVRRSTIR